MDTNIIDFINLNGENIEESQLDNLTDKLIQHYKSKIQYLTYNTYGSVNNETMLAAFQELSKIEIKKALHTFLIKNQYWKTKRDINPYILTTLSRLSDKAKLDVDNIKKINIPICPGCKYFGNREFLISENSNFICKSCSSELDRLKCSTVVDNHILNKKQIYSTFSIHSKKGFKCDDCERFIPKSYCSEKIVPCPYNDCAFFGEIKTEMSHPSASSIRNDLSMDTNYNDGYNCLQNKLSGNNFDVDTHLSVKEQVQIEYDLLLQTIETQMKRAENSDFKATSIQKTLMYKAYRNILIKFPVETISYLVHLKNVENFNIQSTIFQEYVKLIKTALPFTIIKNKKEYDIVSLLSEDLGLFEGVSKFEAVVENGNIINNNTEEKYISDNKDYGPCFIGSIIDIIDKNTKNSIKNNIEEYTFHKIKMDKNISVSTKVEVTHYRINSHYQMGHLVFLRRIRTKIIDSLHIKLYGKGK